MGIYEDESPIPTLIRTFDTRRNVTPDNLGKRVKKHLDEPACDVDWKDIVSDVSGISFSSVVPEVNSAYHEMALSHFGIDAFEIDHTSKLTISITYPEPSQLGPDRIVNAEAAYAEYGEELIIIDLGTAATFCVIEKKGVFDGGIIAPGIGTTIRALAKKASRLPKVKFEKPNNASKATAWNFVKIIGGRLQLVPSDFEIFREVFDAYIAPQEKTTTTNLKLDDNYDPIEEE